MGVSKVRCSFYLIPCVTRLIRRENLGMVISCYFCRPPHCEGSYAACQAFLRSVNAGLESAQRRFLRLGRGYSGRLADNAGIGEGSVGLNSHTLFAPYCTDRDRRKRWEISTLPHSCAFRVRFPWRPWGFTSLDFPESLKEADPPPPSVFLEISVRVSFPSDTQNAWKCVFPIYVFLPFRAPLNNWVGKELELKGR